MAAEEGTDPERVGGEQSDGIEGDDRPSEPHIWTARLRGRSTRGASVYEIQRGESPDRPPWRGSKGPNRA